jgi:outer membrane protein TolC
MNRFPSTRSLLAFALLGLAGCSAVGPDYVPPATQTPGGWRQLDATTPAIAAEESPGDLSQWWLGLGDPLLGELVDEALRASPDLRSAPARLGRWPSSTFSATVRSGA